MVQTNRKTRDKKPVLEQGDDEINRGHALPFLPLPFLFPLFSVTCSRYRVVMGPVQFEGCHQLFARPRTHIPTLHLDLVYVFTHTHVCTTSACASLTLIPFLGL